MTTAKNRALDERRRRKLMERKHGEIALEVMDAAAPDEEAGTARGGKGAVRARGGADQQRAAKAMLAARAAQCGQDAPN